MSWAEFWIILISCAITILACRTLPLLLLKGKELPPSLSKALAFIPAAAFAALIANDILEPGMFDNGIWPAAAIIIASAVVVLVATKSKSLVFSAIAGVASFAILTML